jgi:hypothetical protein
MTPYNLANIGVYERFGLVYCLCLHDFVVEVKLEAVGSGHVKRFSLFRCPFIPSAVASL